MSRTSAHPPLLWAFLPLLLAMASCATSYTATFEISTQAVERTPTEDSVVLNSLGDRFRVGREARKAAVRWEGGERAVTVDDLVEVKVREISRAPGKMTRVLVNGKQVVERPGFLRVKVWWRTAGRKALPPVVWRKALSMKAGGRLSVDQTVTYAAADGSELADLKTTYRFTGPDRGRFTFKTYEPVKKGRVVGVIRVSSDDD